MFEKKNLFNNFQYINEKIFFGFIIFFPLSIILGNLFINFSLILIFFSFLVSKSLKKINFKDPIIILNIIFVLSLFINLIFSIDSINSLPRVIKSLVYLFLIIQLKNFIQIYQYEFEKKILRFWTLIFLILLADISFEIIFGSNILGFTSYYPGRIASFFNNELVVGSFFLTFSLITLNYLIKEKKISKRIIIFYVVTLIIISYLIGERSNFIKFFISIMIFVIFVLKPKLRVIIGTLLSLMIIIATITSTKSTYSSRYYYSLNEIVKNKNLNSYLKSSRYGAHYNGAYKIFQSYPIFGIGIKNFRIEVQKEKYQNNAYTETLSRWATHPHQIHYEFLSETGIFGYLIFIIFIISSLLLSFKNYLKKKNDYQLAAIIITSSSLIPLLPSGSFFSTFSGSLFWINYAIMVAYNKK